MKIIASFAAFSSGIVTGGAFAAVMALVRFFPRLISLSETEEELIMYENLFISGTFLFTIAYFLNFYIETYVILIIVLGLIFGTFLGMFNAALAETLNVIPIISKKFKIKKEIGIVFYYLVVGKILGSIYYFLFY